MPRNGDGSSDNGPMEGGNVIHGNSGDTTLQHAKNNVAPMPEYEKGEALEGLGASGAGSFPREAPVGPVKGVGAHHGGGGGGGSK